MSERIPICFRCAHFAIEPGALDKEHIKKARQAGETPALYGKCLLVGTGKLSQMYCTVKGEEGNLAFEPISED